MSAKSLNRIVVLVRNDVSAREDALNRAKIQHGHGLMSDEELQDYADDVALGHEMTTTLNDLLRAAERGEG